MILVLSYDWYEQGTDPVIDWLIHEKANFVKLSINDLLNRNMNVSLDINKGEVWIDNIEYSKKVKVIWFRRFEHDVFFNFSKKNNNNPLIKQLDREVQLEIIDLMNFLFWIFRDKIWMPHYKGLEYNKLDVMTIGDAMGIKFPKSIICNNKSDLTAFYNKFPYGIVTKPIRKSLYFIKGEDVFSIYTNKITKEFFENIPDYFSVSLFQEMIESTFEIRVFYLDGKFFSTAIITNLNNADIKLSFGTRDINWVPYKLPKEYENKLDAFFKEISLNTCSFDVILTKSDEYIILDINPVGQYSAPSNRCNYQIEREIAKWLINHDK